MGMVVGGAIMVGFPRTTINSLRIFVLDQFWTDLPIVNSHFIENLRSSSWNHLTGSTAFQPTLVIANCRLTSHWFDVLEEDDDEKLGKPNRMISIPGAEKQVTLRASQEGFFNIGSANPGLPRSKVEEEEAEKDQTKTMNENPNLDEFEEKLGEVARQSIPEDGCGRVMHLVKAFETALTLPKSKTETDDEEQNEEIEDDTRKSSESSATFGGTRGKRRTLKATPLQPFKLKTELAEEEELRRLRKELVPKAQPMPYFDRPFIPKRSEKQPTMPKDPKFRNPQHKKMNGGH
ncbi:hypothetical protein L2E82_33491 [Cichorium intybus]|uniref:Uncharacterized protein n=1 Tax=Cichorium intybus TaxID=13427 RepID=A0ACB9BKK2_CICIN|nr:hypothetical protein L2E82_33491 [Cichorium intybus]